MVDRVVRILAAAGACAALVVGTLVPAAAIPVFTRKYDFGCMTCHSNFPRLNDYGVRYRMNGYQLPGREKEEKTVMQGPVPLAMRARAGYSTTSSHYRDGFRAGDLDILSGGLLAPNIGYTLVYRPELEESEGVWPQTATLALGNVIFSNVKSSWLNVRVGRFEPAYLAFSQRRRLSVTPYAVYSYAFPWASNGTESRTGIEITGYGEGGYEYAAGWVNSSDIEDDYDALEAHRDYGTRPSDFYIRTAKVFGMGEGQAVGQRVGLMGYFGRAEIHSWGGESHGDFRRFGADASLNYGLFNIELQYLAGADGPTVWGADSDVDLSGGFAEVNYRPRPRFVCYARYDWGRMPNLAGSDVDYWTVGARYSLISNLALHLEYSDIRMSGAESVPLAFSFAAYHTYSFTTRLDFAF